MTLFSSLNEKMRAGTDKERRKSFGIGGAGNIRTRDQAMVHDVFDLVERRRSRVSGSSIESPTEDRTKRRSSSISETLKHVFKSSSN